MCDKKGSVPVEKIFSSTVDASLSLLKLLSVGLALPLGAGALPIMAYMGRLRPKGGTFFRFQAYERVGISPVNVCERVEKSSISVFKKPKRANRCILWFEKVKKTF